jgi:tyrosyl-tRNA synthetase
MNVLDDLFARGLVQDVSDRDGLAALLAAGPTSFYLGQDPSARSLHCGNLVPISVATRLARAGHRFIALVGGATGMIGDPSGKADERRLLDPATLAANVAAIRGQVERFVSGDAVVVNNADWFTPIGYLAFLRDVGKYITVNYMLAKESVRSRLEERDQGISYTEFSYMLLQGYDFVHLARAEGCRLQIGGADQWGNITCGIELHRKMTGGETPIYGMVAPLLLTASGKKFGKSEKGAVYLDRELTSPYQFHQYWLNADDADVEKYLKMFTFLALDEIAEVLRAHDADRARRIAQRRLADEVTTWVHGAEEARRAAASAAALFSGDVAGVDLDAAPTTDVARGDLARGVGLLELFVRAGICASNSEARRLVSQGGAYVNDARIDDPARSVGEADVNERGIILLRGGKKKIRIVRAV